MIHHDPVHAKSLFIGKCSMVFKGAISCVRPPLYDLFHYNNIDFLFVINYNQQGLMSADIN